MWQHWFPIIAKNVFGFTVLYKKHVASECTLSDRSSPTLHVVVCMLLKVIETVWFTFRLVHTDSPHAAANPNQTKSALAGALAVQCTYNPICHLE
jgi:hypothetical protein